MGVHKKTFIVCIGMFLTLFFVFEGLACAAFEAWDGKLRLGGWMRHDSVFRLEDGDTGLHGADPVVGTQKGLDAWDYVQCRWQLQLEAKWQIQKNLQVTAIGRGFYEASLDITSDLKQNMIDAGAGNEIDDFESDTELRELYFDLALDKWHIRAGKQQIVWGEAAGFRMSDIIKPFGYPWMYFFPSWEDIRIPLWALKLTRRIGYNHSLEFVWLPGKFDNGYQPNRLTPAGSNWAFSGYPQSTLDNIRASIPGTSEDNHEFGLRFKTLTGGGLDASLFWFYSRIDAPVFKSNWLTLLMAGENEIFDFPKTHKIGGTFNQYSNWADAVFHGECVFAKDEPYTEKDTMTMPMTVYEKNTFSYMLSAGKLFKVPAISGRSFLYTSFQFYQKYVLDFEDDMTTADQTEDHVATFMTFYADIKFMYEKLVPSIYLMYSVSGESWARPQIQYDIDDYYQIGIGAQLMDAHNKREPYFGGFQDNNCVYMWAKFGF